MCMTPSLAFARATRLFVGLLVLTIAAPFAVADELRDVLEEALDQPVAAVNIEQAPIEEAFTALEQETGVRLVPTDRTIDLLPYGARTRVGFMIEDLTLRQGLRQLFDGLGLAMEIEGGTVYVVPGPVLERLGRRLTIREVQLLGTLAGGRWQELDADALHFRFQGEVGTDAEGRLRERLAETRAPNATRQLEIASEALGWVWLVDGDAIVVRSRLADVRARLDRTVDLDYERVPLDELLVDLGQRIDVTMHFAPGSLQAVAARERAVDLVQRGITVRQTLELLSGNAGLRYEVAPDGVHISAGDARGRAPVGSSARLVRITIPLEQTGVSLDYILREDELPPAVRALCESRLQELMEDLSRSPDVAERGSP